MWQSLFGLPDLSFFQLAGYVFNLHLRCNQSIPPNRFYGKVIQFDDLPIPSKWRPVYLSKSLENLHHQTINQPANGKNVAKATRCERARIDIWLEYGSCLVCMAMQSGAQSVRRKCGKRIVARCAITYRIGFTSLNYWCRSLVHRKMLEIVIALENIRHVHTDETHHINDNNEEEQQQKLCAYGT